MNYNRNEAPPVARPDNPKVRAIKLTNRTDSEKCCCGEGSALFANVPCIRCAATQAHEVGHDRFIEVYLGVVPLNGLLDSGSNVTLMHPRVVTRLKREEIFAESDSTALRGPFHSRLFAKAVNNTPVDVSTFYEVKVTLGGIQFWYPIRVCENMDLDLILGVDLMKYTVMDMLTSKKTVEVKRWGDKPIVIPWCKQKHVTPLNLNLLRLTEPVELLAGKQTQSAMGYYCRCDTSGSFCTSRLRWRQTTGRYCICSLGHSLTTVRCRVGPWKYRSTPASFVLNKERVTRMPMHYPD